MCNGTITLVGSLTVQVLDARGASGEAGVLSRPHVLPPTSIPLGALVVHWLLVEQHVGSAEWSRDSTCAVWWMAEVPFQNRFPDRFLVSWEDRWEDRLKDKSSVGSPAVNSHHPYNSNPI